jgi:hypothetical protein
VYKLLSRFRMIATESSEECNDSFVPLIYLP